MTKATWEAPTAELPQYQQEPLPTAQSGPDYTNHAEVAARLASSEPMVVATPPVAEDPFAGSNAQLAEWLEAGKIDEDVYQTATGQPVPTNEKPEYQSRHHQPQHAAEPEGAPAESAEVSASVAMAEPETEPTTPTSIEPTAEMKDTVFTDVMEEGGASIAEATVAKITESVDEAVGEELHKHEVPAQPAEAEELTFKTAYKEALKQLNDEEPNLSKKQRKNLAERIANEVMYGHVDDLAGFRAEADGTPATGSLLSRAADLLRHAGVKLETAQAEAKETLRSPERRGLKLTLGALGIVAVAAVGTAYLTYKGAQVVDATIPNLEVFQQDQPMQQDPSLIAKR
jgi:hypothetical protein